MGILEETYQKDLLVKLSHGDEQAFNLLYKAYSRPLYYRVLRMVKNPDIADELLQELFIKLWDKRVTLDTEKSFQSYMYTVAQHMVYNHFRKVSNNHLLIQSLMVSSADHYLDGQELLENKETGKMLQKAIDQLPPQRKQVFRLCKIEGRSYEEAAHIMGISTATVNSHMTKSLQSVKAYMLKNQDIAILLMTAYAINVLKG